MPQSPKTRTEVDGVAVIAIEPATGPHPRWHDRIVTYKGITKALLEDGTEVWLCDGDGRTPCPFTRSKMRSILTHRNSTHNRRDPRPRSLYPEDTLRLVVTEVERAKRDKIKGFCAAAASALNGMRIKTIHGRPWTAESVSALYNQWGKEIRVRVTPRPAKSTTQRAATKVRAIANGHVGGLGSDDLQSLEVFIKIVGPGPLGEALQRLMDAATNQPAQEIVEKARRYDELQALLNQK